MEVPVKAVTPLVERLTDSHKRLKLAATALYTAGYWESDSVPRDVQFKLWEELRDAIGLEPGTATALGMGPEPAKAE